MFNASILKDHGYIMGLTGEDAKEAHYIARFAGQATTRMVTFDIDPDGIHKLHKQFAKMNFDRPEGAASIPPLGRTMQNISDPAATAAKTRSAANMKKTLGVDIGTEIKPVPTVFDTHFYVHPTGEAEVSKSSSESSEPEEESVRPKF